MADHRAWFLALAIGLCTVSARAAQVLTPQMVEQNVGNHIGPNAAKTELWQPGYPGGVAVVVLAKNGPFSVAHYFFNYGCAVGTQPAAGQPCVIDQETKPPTPMSSASVVNLASVGKLFAAVYLARSINLGDMALNNPPGQYITTPPLLTGTCIGAKTLGGVVSQSSGLPYYPDKQSCPHRGQYNYESLIDNLNCWGNGSSSPCPTSQYYQYSDVGFILLRLALSQHFNTTFPALVQQFAQAVQMNQTTMTVDLAAPQVVQGYRCYSPQGEAGVENSDCDGQPVPPAQEQNASWYQDQWDNGGQIWSSTQDMGQFAGLALDLPQQNVTWWKAMQTTEHVLFTGCAASRTQCPPSAEVRVAMAWQETFNQNGTRILGKNGGIAFTSTYIGLAPDQQLAVVILVNRGKVPAAGAGQEILGDLASFLLQPSKP